MATNARLGRSPTVSGTLGPRAQRILGQSEPLFPGIGQGPRERNINPLPTEAAGDPVVPRPADLLIPTLALRRQGRTRKSRPVEDRMTASALLGLGQ